MGSEYLRSTPPLRTFVTRLSLVREHPDRSQWCASREALQISHASVTLWCSQGEIYSCSSITSNHWLPNSYAQCLWCILFLQGKKKACKDQDRWNREGLNSGIWPFTDVFDFFDLVNKADLHFYLWSVIHTTYFIYCIFFGMKEREESVDRGKNSKRANVSTCANGFTR